jgi:hypothetical protein
MFQLAVGLMMAMSISAAAQTDPLPSWNDTATKTLIVAFVEKVVEQGGANFVPPEERIATFDHDGTLWAERPLPVQLAFALDRVKALAPDHPEWIGQEPFATLLKGDVKGALAQGEKAIVQIITATHAGMTAGEFETIVKDWIAVAEHPTTGHLHTEMAYRPMLELLEYLRANDFKTYIVSGGGSEFMRAFAEEVYGIPPEQVIGSAGKLQFEMRMFIIRTRSASGPMARRRLLARSLRGWRRRRPEAGRYGYEERLEPHIRIRTVT